MAPAPAGWRLVLLATFTIGLANSVIFAVIGDLQDQYGFADAGLGLIAGIGFLTALLAQLFMAPLADRGHARLVLLGGLSLAVLGAILFAFGSTLVGFVAARAVVGISIGSFLPAARAIGANLTGADAGARLGRLASIELAGFVSGPVVGGLLVDPLGIRGTFLVFAGVTAAVLLALAPRHLPEPPRIDGHHGLSLGLVRIPELQVALLLALAIFIPVGVYDALWDRYLTDRGASNIVVGLSFGLYGLPFILLATRGGRLAERVGPVRSALVSLVAVAPLTVLYGVFSQPWLIIAVGLVEGSVQAIATPAVQLAVAGAAPHGRAAAAQGVAGATQLAGAAMAAFLAAPLYGALGPVGLFTTAGAAIALFGVLAAARSRRLRELAAVS